MILGCLKQASKVYSFTGLPSFVYASNTFWQLGLFHRPGSNAVGPIEEVGIVGRSTGDEEEVLLWAFQGRNGRIVVVLQMLQLRMAQPRAASILRHTARA